MVTDVLNFFNIGRLNFFLSFVSFFPETKFVIGGFYVGRSSQKVHRKVTN